MFCTPMKGSETAYTPKSVRIHTLKGKNTHKGCPPLQKHTPSVSISSCGHEGGCICVAAHILYAYSYLLEYMICA